MPTRERTLYGWIRPARRPLFGLVLAPGQPMIMPQMFRKIWLLTVLAGAQVGSAQVYWEPLLRRELLCGPVAHERVECFSSRGEGLTNEDGGNYLGLDSENWNILCDISGPGCLAEFGWTRRNPGADLRFKFYIDSFLEDELNVRADSLCGRTSPFLPPLADSLSGWSWNYVPIPFQDRLRITYIGNSIAYHGTALIYPEGTAFESFRYPVPLPFFLKRDTLETMWNQPTRPFFANLPAQTMLADSTLPSFVTAELVDHEGAGVVRRVWMVPQDTTRSYLDRTVARIYVDHNPEPSISAQVGMLFGCSEGVTSYTSALTGRIGDTLYFQAPLPFSTGVRVEIENNVVTPNTNRVRIGLDVVALAPQDVPAYRLAGQVNGSTPTARFLPFRAAELAGRGHFLGLYWEADNTSGAVLEGDEVISVDGDIVRAGLGTPEYFNGSNRWIGANNQPALTRNYAHGVVTVTNNDFAAYHWHLTDPMPFDESLTMDFEVGAWGHLTGNFRSIAWGYVEPQRWRVRDQDSSYSAHAGEVLTIFGRGQRNGRILERVIWNGYPLDIVGGNTTVVDSVLVVRVRAPFSAGGSAPLVAEFNDGQETIVEAWAQLTAPEVSFRLKRDEINGFACAADTLEIEGRGYPELESISIEFAGVTLPWVGTPPEADADGVVRGRVVMPLLPELVPETRAQIEAHAISIEGYPVAVSEEFLTAVRLERFEIERMPVALVQGGSLTELCACDYSDGLDESTWGRMLVRRMTVDTTGEFASFVLPVRSAGNYRLSYFVGHSTRGGELAMLLDSLPDIARHVAWDTTLADNVWSRSDTLRGAWRYLEAGNHVVKFTGTVPFDTAGNVDMILDQIILESEFHIEIPSDARAPRALPQSAALLPPYPNPFNATARLRFTLLQSAPIQLEIFNLLGQRVAVLAEGRFEAGSYEREFACPECASGLYLARFSLPDAMWTQKMLLLK